MFAGQTEVHRPHTVQASVSNSCFHVNSEICDAPMTSMSSTSMRFGIAFMAPLGRSLGERNMFVGEVTTCRSLVVGNITRNAKNEAAWLVQNTRCQAEAASGSNRAESGYPMKLQTSKSGRPIREIRAASVRRPVTPTIVNRDKIQKSSGFVFDLIRHGFCT